MLQDVHQCYKLNVNCGGGGMPVCGGTCGVMHELDDAKVQEESKEESKREL